MKMNLNIELDQEEKEAARRAASSMVDKVVAGEGTESDIVQHMTFSTLKSMMEDDTGPAALFLAILTALEIGKEFGRRGIESEVQGGLSDLSDFLSSTHQDEPPSPNHRDFSEEG